MFKKSLSVILVFIFILSIFAAVPMTVQARVSGDFRYDVWVDGTARITQYIGQSKDVVIPERIDECTVSIIGEGAFSGLSINSVSIPETVKTIEKKAFFRCQDLRYVGLDYNYKTKQGVQTIGERAFELFWAEDGNYYTNTDRPVSLQNVMIPPSVNSIGICAFGYYVTSSRRNNRYENYYEGWYSISITGYNGTEAQNYANRNPAINFSSLGEVPTPPTEPPTVPPTEPTTAPEFRQMSDCTVILSQTSYTYDGAEKKPGVTVTDGSKLLTEGTDYMLVYANNVEVGTAAVVVIGMGGYTGTVNKSFTITEPEKPTEPATEPTTAPATAPATEPTTAPATAPPTEPQTEPTAAPPTVPPTEPPTEPVIRQISDCTITLSQTSYEYDGSEKKPDVTVKDGNKTLTLGADYSVSYKNNTDPGTAVATVTGTGNYSGSVNKYFTITGKPASSFVWGSDNWNFNNSSYQGYFKDSTYREQISDEYLQVLKNNLNNVDYQYIFEGFPCCGYTAWLDDEWGGSCYGMSSTALLAKNGLLPYANYKTGATKLNDLSAPTKNGNVSSLVTYYQMLQIKDVIQQQYRTVPYRTHEQNIKNIIELLDANPVVLIGFQKSDWGGHAILATGYEYGSWSWNGVAYQGRIHICDPNASVAYNENQDIYFNTQSYNWTIPGYSGMTSVNGAEFNYIGATVEEINEGGYLSGTSAGDLNNFVARINADAISANRSVTKVESKNGSYINRASAPGDIIEDYSFVLGGESKGKIGYNLYDSKSSYKISQNNAEKLQLEIDYRNCNLNAGSKAGKEVIFDPSGFVQVSGESADYNMTMTFNDDHPTDWFTIQVDGEGADTSSLRKVKDGFILASDNLTNVRIRANNRDKAATLNLSADVDSVLVYEIDETTIGLKIDADNNGTYETELPMTGLIIGDVDGNGRVTIDDATELQKYLAHRVTFKTEQELAADTNGDGRVSIDDATQIQKYLAKMIEKLG